MANEQHRPHNAGHYLGRLASGTLRGILTYVGVIVGIFAVLWGIGRARSCGKASAVAGTGEMVAGFELGERVEEPTYHYSYQPLAGSTAVAKQSNGMLSYNSTNPAISCVGFALRRDGSDTASEAQRVASLLSLAVEDISTAEFTLMSAETDENGQLQYARGIVTDDGIYALTVYYPADNSTLEQVARHLTTTLQPGSAS